MSAYLVNGELDEPLPIPGTDGRRVTFKRAASYGDDLHCDAVAALLPLRTPERTKAYVLARTVVMIAAWDLTDHTGQPLPVTPESIAGLSKEAGNFLADQALVRFRGRSEEEERPFERPSPEPSTAAEPTTPR